MKIILVEDEPTQSLLIEEFLRGGDPPIECLVADTLSRGLALAASQEVDAVLLELSLPDSEGVLTIETMRSATEAPIVVFSAQPDLGERAIRAGADEYLLKGVAPPQAVRRAVVYAIERHRYQGERGARLRRQAGLAALGRIGMTSDSVERLLASICETARHSLGAVRAAIVQSGDHGDAVQRTSSGEEAPGRSPAAPDMSAPILVRGTGFGMLSVWLRAGGMRSEQDEEFLRTVADFTGEAIGRMRAEELLKAREARLRAILDHEPECVKTVSAAGILLDMNPAGLRMIEASEAGEVLGRPALNLVHPEDRAAFVELHTRCLRGGSGELSFRVMGLRGTERWMETSAVPLRDAEGRVESVLSVTRDVTSRRRAENELQRSQSLLEIAGRLGRIGAWSVDLPSRTLTWSPEVRSIHEVGPDYVPTVEQGIAFYAPEHRPVIAAAFEECAARGTPFDVELQIVTAKGRRVWVRAIGEPHRDEQQVIRSVHGAFQDISSSKAAAEEARALSERLTATLERMADAFLLLDSGWRFVYVNPEAERVLGRKASDLVGRVVWAEFPEAVGTLFQSSYERALREQVSVRFEEYYPPLGKWLAVRAFPSSDGLAIHFRDITEERAAALRIAQQAALIDEASDAIFVRDLEGRIVFWSKGARKVYGWAPEEAIGRNAQELLDADGTDVEGTLATILRRGHASASIQVKTSSGARLTVERRITLLRDDNGSPQAILTFDADVTERRKLEQEILRFQRVESVGRVATGISHDLNNLLMPILTGTALLRRAPSPQQIELAVQMIEKSARRGADLVNRVLAFARGEQSARIPVDLGDLIRETQSMARATFPSNIATDVEIAAGLWYVEGDPGQLYRILINLCANARDAMPAGGRLLISASNVEASEEPGGPTLPAGRCVRLEIADTGIGIPAEVSARIFDPFFTTKDERRGSGLGLANAAAIIREAGGTIEVQSTVGEGTVFRIHLPASGSPSEATGDPLLSQAG